MANIALQGTPVLVIGAGIMGAGIAQVAAHSGHPVWLFDAREGAAAQAKEKMAGSLQALVAKGKFQADEVTALLARITPAAHLNEAAAASLVVEAIVENLAAKRGLFQQLEALVGPHCVLATNTSSISVTAIANGLKHPGRLVGMHFFNPVPLMKLVEVVSGLATAPEVAEAIVALAKAWNKVPVHARSTPGFIVNRIARPYYAETLALLLEQAATPLVIDSCLKAAGFRMGPCELMDLVGHDTNFAVTNSVFAANFFDKRYQPSLLQQDMVDGGLFGRKSGQGFYTYPAGVPTLPVAVFEAPHTAGVFTVHGSGPVADALAQAATAALAPQGWGPKREPASAWVGVEIDGGHLVQTDGRCAFERAREFGTHDVAVFDQLLQLPAAPGTALAFALPAGASEAWAAQAPAWLAALGFAPQRLSDCPGLVVARTVAMLVNEASDAVLQGVCTPEGANAAMKLGVSYPAGPFEWLERWGRGNVMAVLRGLDAHYRGERYRISPWLQRQG